MDKKGHSESTWECKPCQMEQKGVKYEDIAYVGIPICPECGEDMELVGEVWIEAGV